MHTPTDSVRIVLFDKANPTQFVALSETDDLENLKLPGGKFEGDESPDQAAQRELQEELGITPEQLILTQAGELVNDDGESKRYIYTAEIELGRIKPSDEIHHIESLTVDTIPEGKNQGHMRTAVTLAETASSK